MEEGEARHYFPESALQARVRHFGARRKTVPLVGNTPPRFRRVGEGRPTSGVGGRVSYTLGEEGPAEVWK